MPRTREVTDAVEIHARVQLVPQFYELLTANVTTTPKGCEPLGGLSLIHISEPTRLEC